MIDARPTLYMIAGPNGAGKSTLYETKLSFLDLPFINADQIQKEHLGDSAMDASYKAAKIAAEIRDSLIKAKKSFITESVFSHPSKLELLKEAIDLGYRVVVFHVGVSDSDLSVERVSNRVSEGGHDVPQIKIRQRFDRNKSLIKKAMHLADRGYVFDNSGLNEPPKLLIKFRNGQTDFMADDISLWALDLYYPINH